MALARFTFEADGVLIQGEGVVQVTGAPPADLATALLEFLDAQDPAELEQRALDRMVHTGGQLTAAVLDLLRDEAASA